MAQNLWLVQWQEHIFAEAIPCSLLYFKLNFPSFKFDQLIADARVRLKSSQEKNNCTPNLYAADSYCEYGDYIISRFDSHLFIWFYP